MRTRLTHSLLLFVFLSSSGDRSIHAQTAQVAEEFDRKVAPILAGNCLECHRGKEAKAKLDLSQRDTAYKGGKSGKAIVAGDLSKSLLWKKVAEDEMPPKHPLSEKEKKILRAWITNGAAWGIDPIDPFSYSSRKRAGYDWWSLQPLKKPEVPAVHHREWAFNEIDHFVVARLKTAGLIPSPRADPRTLVRRLYYDLVGLPAPPDVIAAFAENSSPSQWKQLADELLASRHYGERWARHWMDVARFGESGGYEYNTPRESAWHYRDWLIRSLNNDLPYDQFARMQLAGDIIKPNTIEGAAAVGFLVAGIHNEVLGKNPKMKQTARQDELEEIVGTVAQTFLGMTVNCARCHNHKFDPISAREYYQFIAALDGIKHGTKKLNQAHGSAEKLSELERRKTERHRHLVELVSSRNGPLSTTANQVDLKNPIDANRKGVSYRVSLNLAPTVWASPAQATRENDGVVVRIIKGDNRVLASQLLKPEPWNGGKNATGFQLKSFTYQGDGMGQVRLQVQPSPLNSGRFGGAIDDLRISNGTTTIFEDNFDNLKRPRPPGAQADTKLKVFYGASSEKWTHSGTHAIHAVEYAPGNFAVQLFGGNAKGAVLRAETLEEKKVQSQIAQLEQEIKALIARTSTTVFTVRPGKPGIMRVHRRGSVSSLGDEVAPGGLKAISKHSPSFGISKKAPDAQRRLKLAEWISAPNNSLFHRVIVNRVWHYHFGRGIVDSPNDFGFNGGRPSHPQLLDWLALWFRENGYSLKKLHRLIVTSATYQQSSSVRANATHTAAEGVDKSNRLLWRQNPRRVDAETLRDSILAIAGALNRQSFGPGYKDVRIDKVPPANYYIAIDPIGAQFNRRTIYRWQVRGQRSALLDTFDCPDPSVTAPTRNVTTTPSQALSQWNHPFVLRMSKRLADRVVKEAGTDVTEQVNHAWGLVLGRAPDHDEAGTASQLVEQHGLALLARILFNSNESIWIE